MDQKKIGEFISQCRKEKNLTQQDLADILHVTDRAVSNWERGIRMPDVSFYKPLCEALDISINELLAGCRIDSDNKIDTSEKQLIQVLENSEESQKKMKKMTIIFIILIGILLLFIAVSYSKTKNHEIPIYNIEAWYQDSDKEYSLDKIFHYDSYDVYYYGLEKVDFCDYQDCYEMKDAFHHKQVNKDTIRKYLESEKMQNRIESHIYYDGGTTTYQSDHYMIVFCNTVEGNQDIYVGVDDMLERLDGEYCGHPKSELKKFTRTYYVEAVYEDTVPDYLILTLHEFQGDVATVKIGSGYPLTVGKNYEFTFFTYEEFSDTIPNIFEHSTLIKIQETDKIGLEQTQEKIVVNEQYVKSDELNEIPEVSMKIKKGTLTSTSATILITDFSNGKWIYGEDYSIQKDVYGEWQTLDYVRDNIAFNAMAYSPDPNGILEMKLEWKGIFGVLQKGKYRILKYALPQVERAVTEEDKKYISVEFEI